MYPLGTPYSVGITYIKIKMFKINYTSIRAVYVLIAVLLIVALINDWGGLVALVSFMLLFAATTGKCPSMWLFEKIGFRKTEL